MSAPTVFNFSLLLFTLCNCTLSLVKHFGIVAGMNGIVENKAELSVVIIIKQLRERLSSTWHGRGVGGRQRVLEVRDLRTPPHPTTIPVGGFSQVICPP